MIGAAKHWVFAEFKGGEAVLHRLFLCAAGKLLLETFSGSSKKEPSKGLPGSTQAGLMVLSGGSTTW